MFSKQKFAFRVAFPFKYVAINNLTGREVKLFRTLRGALRWYRKPVIMLGLKVPKSAMFITVHEIEDPIGYLATIGEDVPDAFTLMAEYAKADVEATQAMFQGFAPTFAISDEVQQYDPAIDDEFPQGWCELCQVNHYDDGIVPEIKRGDEEPTLPGFEEPMPHWERELLGVLDNEPGEPPIYCPNDCEDCDNLKAQAEAEAIAEAESNDALRTLRAILGAEVIEEEPVVVLISVDDFIDQLWTDDEIADQEDLVTDDQLTYVVHGYVRETYTAEEAPHVFYQLTPEAVERLGDFVPVTIETPEEFNQKLTDQQAQEFYQGISSSSAYRRGLGLSEPLTDEERDNITNQAERDEYLELEKFLNHNKGTDEQIQRYKELHERQCFQCYTQEQRATKAAETNGINPSA